MRCSHNGSSGTALQVGVGTVHSGLVWLCGGSTRICVPSHLLPHQQPATIMDGLVVILKVDVVIVWIEARHGPAVPRVPSILHLALHALRCSKRGPLELCPRSAWRSQIQRPAGAEDCEHALVCILLREIGSHRINQQSPLLSASVGWVSTDGWACLRASHCALRKTVTSRGCWVNVTSTRTPLVFASAHRQVQTLPRATPRRCGLMRRPPYLLRLPLAIRQHPHGPTNDRDFGVRWMKRSPAAGSTPGEGAR